MSKITNKKEEWREEKPGENANQAWDKRMEHIGQGERERGEKKEQEKFAEMLELVKKIWSP
jgi:hypothetical protein